MIKLLFIRHGATAGNLEKRYIGRTDEALCDTGIKQIEELKKNCFEIDRLYASPMLRTIQSAKLLFPQVEYTLVEGFKETDFGIFEAKTADELSSNEEYQAWLDSNCRGPIPGGESVDDFKSRCCNAFCDIAESLPEDTSTAFIVHGGVIMSILEKFALPKKSFYEYYAANGGGFICCLDEGIHILGNI